MFLLEKFTHLQATLSNKLKNMWQKALPSSQTFCCNSKDTIAAITTALVFIFQNEIIAHHIETKN